MIDTICDVAIGVMDNTCSRSFTNDDTYHNSDWRAGQLTALDAFSAHQKERAELLSWIQDASDIIAADPKPYYFWPFISGVCNCNLTKKILSDIAIYSRKSSIDTHYESLKQAFNDYDINNCSRIIHFLAQVIHESGSLRYTAEQGVSDTAYGGYKGRGLLQLTGESNYKAYENYEGEDFTSTIEKKSLLEHPPYAARSAVWFWSIRTGLNMAADNNDFLYLTYRINGGFNGFSDRLDWVNKGVEVLKLVCSKAGQLSTSYDFSSSDIYNIPKACFGWGIWNDPGLPRYRGCVKNDTLALEGYRRFVDLVPEPGLSGESKWYGHKKNNILSFVKTRIQELS